ncbi:protein translocase subunit SecF [Granulicella cerasi]|uniref:Protein-export membrane protein SecF n=1 Tax=Granulicella cerasi TaxID=741063 RepID=A0ABW1ZA97_9BACT|nr:protein translocase subunit SecF [Granulicella cerasi]
MEFFRSTNIDWLGKKWYFLGFSLIFSVAGVLSMCFWHGIPKGVDFKGGSQVKVSFTQQPNEDTIRTSMDRSGIKDATIQRLNGDVPNEVLITLPQQNEASLDASRQAVINALGTNFSTGSFKIEDSYTVGPKAGQQLQQQALLATVYSLLGMLIYLWFRFELIYGVAAVVAVFHDTLITIGAFSLTNKEISLTVIAALLTLIGYSMNDTIVVFDRIREDLLENRRETLAETVNRAINQTLSRTVLTSGLTFLTVLCLFLFGGEVLHPFSFALVVGILIGTYSSIAVAAPMLVAYQEWRSRTKGTAATLPTGKAAKPVVR